MPDEDIERKLQGLNHSELEWGNWQGIRARAEAAKDLKRKEENRIGDLGDHADIWTVKLTKVRAKEKDTHDGEPSLSFRIRGKHRESGDRHSALWSLATGCCGATHCLMRWSKLAAERLLRGDGQRPRVVLSPSGQLAGQVCYLQVSATPELMNSSTVVYYATDDSK